MKLTPQSEMEINNNVVIQKIPTLTYRVQKEKEIVSGTVDELEAMKQAVFQNSLLTLQHRGIFMLMVSPMCVILAAGSVKTEQEQSRV